MQTHVLSAILTAVIDGFPERVSGCKSGYFGTITYGELRRMSSLWRGRETWGSKRSPHQRKVPHCGSFSGNNQAVPLGSLDEAEI